jgi:hypothetical protein
MINHPAVSAGPPPLQKSNDQMLHWPDLSREDRVALITENWNENCSAKTLAVTLTKLTGSQVTRNSIMGFYTRVPELRISYPLGGGGVPGQRQLRDEHGNKLPRQHAPRLEKRKRKKLNYVRGEVQQPAKVPVAEVNLAYDRTALKLALWELGPNQCHWGINEPAPGERHLFCGHGTEGHPRYCPNHRGRLFQTRRTSR